MHTSQLPDGNRTTDAGVIAIADQEARVVVTKDHDFRDSHLLTRTPRRLLVVATGNISNDGLLDLLVMNLDAITAALEQAAFVELTVDRLLVHQRPR